MAPQFTWNDDKRARNLAKHGLDFGDADMVLDNPYRLDVASGRKGETREQSFAFVFERLAVLTVVHIPGVQPHIISFRPASRVEREIYHEWLENDFDES
jgi:uncharacterized DUF497 family protein